MHINHHEKTQDCSLPQLYLSPNNPASWVKTKQDQVNHSSKICLNFDSLVNRTKRKIEHIQVDGGNLSNLKSVVTEESVPEVNFVQ